jgi:tetratricopeptide (TPR) repeat protein
MTLFGKATYDRTKILARAAKAEAKGQHRKALAEYRRVFEKEPENAAVLAKLAVLLARTQQYEEALQRFATCAERYAKQGFDEKALAVYRQAVGFLPRQVQLWEQIAVLHGKRGHDPDAIAALLEGRSKLRKRKLRGAAIQLLRAVRKIDPWHFEATLDLGRLLAKTHQRGEARRLLEALCDHQRGHPLRVARGALFWLSPTPAAAWHWLQAALRARVPK